MNQDIEQQLRAIFREEAADILGELRALLGGLRGARQATFEQQLSSAMRLAHNLKGAAGNVGLTDVEEASHALEEAFLALKNAGLGALEATVPQLLASVRDIEGLIETAEAQRATPEASRTASPTKAGLSRDPRTAEGFDAGEGAEDPRTGLSPIVDEAVEAQLTASKVRTIRIEAERLDKLLELVSSLLVAETDMRERHQAFEALRERMDYRLGGGTEDPKARLESALRTLDALILQNRNALSSFSRLSQELQAAMKRARMVPLSSLTNHLRRSVDDAARYAGKLVDLEVQFSDIELDKVILEHLRDPLMHLLRNAVDHGLESTEVRDLKGKPERGLVRISADLVGASVRITVADDGRGIDQRALAEAVVAKGLLTADQVAALSEESLIDLVFAPGFSTRTETTRLSGRGVGLDVVRSAVTDLGGSVRAHARGPLGGAAFAMTLPLSLLSTRLLLVSAGDSVCAVPVESIDRAQRASKQDLTVVDGVHVVQLNETEWIRVVWLSAALSGRKPREQEHFKVLVVSQGERRLGIVVDELLREEELVVRKLPWNVQSVPGVSGATVLADGSVALVVDVGGLTTGNTPEIARTDASPADAQILVVDDSMTTRTLHGNVLSFAGYQVQTAHDGSEAWALLQHTPFRVVVSDVQMPGLDGFELTRRIRADARFKHVKIILVTSLDSAEDRERGMRAGADAYVVKGPLERDALLAAVAEQLGT